MSDNYKTWEIKTENFPSSSTLEEQIKFILNFGNLAPSGHNTQPWQLNVNETQVILKIKFERSLPQSDPEGKQLAISLGCFLENTILAGKFYGFECAYKTRAQGSPKDWKIFIHFKKSSRVYENKEIVEAMLNRHSNRYPYEKQPLTEKLLGGITSKTDPQADIIYVSDEKQKIKIAEICINAQINAMEKPDFRQELSEMIKSNYTSDYKGMPGFVLNIPGPVSLIAGLLMKKINLSKFSKKQDFKLLFNYTAGYLIFLNAQNNFETWLKTGLEMQKTWLNLTIHKVAASPLAAAAQIPEFANQITDLLNTKKHLQMIMRVGLPKIIPRHTPRFKLQDLLFKNQ